MKRLKDCLTALGRQGAVTVIDSGDDGCAVLYRRTTSEKTAIMIIASIGMGWDHVSVSLDHRCPTWTEMEEVKRAFFRDSETAMQLHVPPEDHINAHPYCLHLWRPQRVKIPRPPAIMVAPKQRRVG